MEHFVRTESSIFVSVTHWHLAHPLVPEKNPIACSFRFVQCRTISEKKSHTLSATVSKTHTRVSSYIIFVVGAPLPMPEFNFVIFVCIFAKSFVCFYYIWHLLNVKIFSFLSRCITLPTSLSHILVSSVFYIYSRPNQHDAQIWRNKCSVDCRLLSLSNVISMKWKWNE